MRGFMVAGLAAFSILAPSVAHASDWSRKYTLSGKAELRVETNDASVDVRSGDVNWIEARVTTVGWRINASEVNVVESQAGNVVNLGVRVPREFFGIGNRSAHITLIVPRQLTAVIRTADGHISADGLSGDIRLSSGDGRIDAQRMDGVLDAATGDGRIEISGRFDKLNVKTNDGAVVVKIGDGSKMAGPWRVQSGDGSVEIGVGDKFNADIDAHTGDGHITVDVPVTMSRSRGESTFRGKLNAGGEALVVRTGDGAIHIRRTIL